MIKQYYEYIAVVDFEATCNTNQGNNYPHEIIEFPIVLIDVQQQMIVIYLIVVLEEILKNVYFRLINFNPIVDRQ
jgi:3'-5' exoribonuclease 1